MIFCIKIPAITMNQTDKDNLKINNHIKQQLSNFSIEHILNHAGAIHTSTNIDDSSSYNRLNKSTPNQYEHKQLSWLQYTRFCPPKLLRQRRNGHNKVPMKRQLGRHPRIPFTNTQISILEAQFKETPYLSSEQVNHLSRLLELADIRIKIWFQNRRARERREQQNQQIQTSPKSNSNSNNNESGPMVPTYHEIFQQSNITTNFLEHTNCL